MNVLKKLFPLSFRGKTAADLMSAIATTGALMWLVYWATSWMSWPWIHWLAVLQQIVAINYFLAGVVFAFLYKFNVFK